MKNWMGLFLVVIFASGVLLCIEMFYMLDKIPAVSASTIDGAIWQTGRYPWDIGTQNLWTRLQYLKLPALTAEGTVLHTHQHLDILIQGQPVEVPAQIGINETAGFIAPLHTHDTTGIIHVESPTVETYTLGQFMTIWGVRLTDTCLGGYCTGNGNQLTVYVNGRPAANNFADIPLTAHEEIAIVYGKPAELPQPIPSTYTFPAGY